MLTKLEQGLSLTFDFQTFINLYQCLYCCNSFIFSTVRQLELDPAQKKLVAPAKYEVVKKIEMEANAARRDRSFMLRDDMMFLAKMISKHGIDEWTAMARDPDNLYQLTPKQIKGLYKKCQKVPTHYNALMMACGLQPVPDGYSLDAAK